jgi:hypothetical protein
MGRFAAGGVLKLPVTGSLTSLASARSTMRTRQTICWPDGRPARSSLVVKSLSSNAAGPSSERASAKLSVVARSTSMRAGRSARAQRIAHFPSRSPVWTPYGACGRARALVITARAPCWASARSGLRPAEAGAGQRRAAQQGTPGEGASKVADGRHGRTP